METMSESVPNYSLNYLASSNDASNTALQPGQTAMRPAPAELGVRQLQNRAASVAEVANIRSVL